MGTCTLSAICTGQTSRCVSFKCFFVLPTRQTAVRHNITTIEDSTMCSIALAFDPELSDNFSLLFHLTALMYFALPLLALIIMYFRIGVAVKVTLHRWGKCNKKRFCTAFSRSAIESDYWKYVHQSTTVSGAVNTYDSTGANTTGRRWRK